MTDEQVALIKRLSRCRFGVGTYDKRFVRDMSYQVEHDSAKELTTRQARYLTWLHWRYRRQLGEPDLPRPVLEPLPETEAKPAAKGAPIFACGRNMGSAQKQRDKDLKRLASWNEGKAREE